MVTIKNTEKIILLLSPIISFYLELCWQIVMVGLKKNENLLAPFFILVSNVVTSDDLTKHLNILP